MDNLKKKSLNATSGLLNLLIPLLFACSTNVPEFCIDHNPLDPLSQFCHEGKAMNKCGWKDYDPSKQGCCGGKVYDLSTQGCYSGEIRSDVNTLTLNITPTGGGTVSRSPNQTTYNWGDSVTVTATAASGYKFTEWSGAVTSTSPVVTIKMDDNKILTANFDTSFVNPNTVVKGTFTDSRDNHVYKTVKIGRQMWMAENLNYATSSGSWCLDCDKYGRLYDFNTSRTVCPSGWHLSTDEEWHDLAESVGGVMYQGLHAWHDVGKKLKSKSGWNYGNGTDDYGFSALPGGRRSSGQFGENTLHGDWWDDSVPYDGWISFVSMDGGDDLSGISTLTNRDSAFSVRCVADVRQ
jgi:uncharacterized protein (TIGR02145 family)